MTSLSIQGRSISRIQSIRFSGGSMRILRSFSLRVYGDQYTRRVITLAQLPGNSIHGKAHHHSTSETGASKIQDETSKVRAGGVLTWPEESPDQVGDLGPSSKAWLSPTLAFSGRTVGDHEGARSWADTPLAHDCAPICPMVTGRAELLACDQSERRRDCRANAAEQSENSPPDTGVKLKP